MQSGAEMISSVYRKENLSNYADAHDLTCTAVRKKKNFSKRNLTTILDMDNEEVHNNLKKKTQ